MQPVPYEGNNQRRWLLHREEIGECTIPQFEMLFIFGLVVGVGVKTTVFGEFSIRSRRYRADGRGF